MSATPAARADRAASGAARPGGLLDARADAAEVAAAARAGRTARTAHGEAAARLDSPTPAATR